MLKLLSPAKINLFLHILGIRKDGYHELQTVFQFLNYCDTLTFNLNNSGKINRTDNAKKYTNDLIIRAGQLLQQTTACKLGATIALNKIIPEGGGLGGGSSNAATTLVALNQLWQLNLSTKQLAKIGLELGADVPVFVHGRAAWATGIGEVLTPINPPQLWYLVINPKVKINTQEIFNAKELTRDSTSLKIRTLSFNEWRNDCVEAVINRYPEVKKAMQCLNDFGVAKLTGTGACVFVSFNAQSSAESALLAINRLPNNWQGFVALANNRSPLYKDLTTDGV